MPVRVGFLGAGLAARIHHQWLSRVGEEVRWAAVYDPDLRRAHDFSSLTGARLCHEEEEVFELSDAVYVCTWTSEHPRLVAAAARHRLPVYCEKPLAVSLELARQMARQVREAGIANQAGLVLRHSPAFHWARHLLNEPTSGRLMSISFRDDQYLPVDGYYASRWRSDPSLAGSGVLLEHSIHDIDILEFLAGPVRSLSCSTQSVHEIRGIEDVAHVSLEFESGMSGSLTTLWHDILARPNERRVEIFCENLWCAVDGHHHWGPVHWQRGKGSLRSARGEELVPLAATAGLENPNPGEAFIGSVLAGKPAHPDFALAVRAHELVDAAYRSASEGSRVVHTPK